MHLRRRIWGSGPDSRGDACVARMCVSAACAIMCIPPVLPAQETAHPDTTTRVAGHKAKRMSSADSLAIPAAATKTGCATIDIRITGAGRATVTRVPASECGPITPEIVGEVSVDVGVGALRIPVAVHNGGEDWLHAPALVTARTDGEVSGRCSYDSLLHAAGGPSTTASDGSVVLARGETSAPCVISVPLERGVDHIAVTLSAAGTYTFTVPGRPPDDVSRDELMDSRSPENVVTGDPHFPGRVVRNTVWLLFRRQASAEDREAAIEAVNGIVVGGSIRGSGNRYPPPSGPHMQRYYYVRIPAYPDSGAGPLERALQTLATQPAVQDVQPDVLPP